MDDRARRNADDALAGAVLLETLCRQYLLARAAAPCGC